MVSAAREQRGEQHLPVCVAVAGARCPRLVAVSRACGSRRGSHRACMGSAASSTVCAIALIGIQSLAPRDAVRAGRLAELARIFKKSAPPFRHHSATPTNSSAKESCGVHARGVTRV